MEEIWSTFLETGRIDDYLAICRQKERENEQEVKHNGTESGGDRNGLKCDADWRV